VLFFCPYAVLKIVPLGLSNRGIFTAYKYLYMYSTVYFVPEFVLPEFVPIQGLFCTMFVPPRLVQSMDYRYFVKGLFFTGLSLLGLCSRFGLKLFVPLGLVHYRV
jgi:hypothetical protein